MDKLTLQYRPNSQAEVDMRPSEARLCGKCFAISWDLDERMKTLGRNGSGKWRLDHHDTFGELETSCETGCPLCQTLLLLAVYDIASLKSTDLLHWNIRINWGKCSLVFGTEALPDKGRAWLMQSDDEIQSSQSIKMVKSGLSASTLEEDLKTLLDESINPWIEACTRSGTHKACATGRPNELCSYHVPTRLIDVGTGSDSSIRLIVTKDLPEKDRKPLYIILSYCWGSGNDSARTTSKNLDERLKKIRSENLPQTIKDAIRLTQLMKIQYLWVDAVCIIQSDRNSTDEQGDTIAKIDWERESLRMGSYYTNSLCCISASNAKDSSEGMLSERRAARYRTWYNPPNVFLQSPFAVRRRCPSLLFDRGWCLQEWILSPRILHWTANGLVWECSQGFFWEGQSGFAGESPEKFRETRLDSEDRKTNDCLLDLGFSQQHSRYMCQILSSEKEDAIGQGWTALVEHYARMHLSFFGDRLAAIHGIASLLSARHGVDYFAGVFRPQCLEQLLWMSEDPKESLDASDNFPSWSWLSSKGEIRFMTTSEYDISDSWMENLAPFPSSQHETSLSRVMNKELCFTAPLMRLTTLDPGDARSDSNDSANAWAGHYWFLVGSGSPFWQRLTCNIHLDSLGSFSTLKGCTFLLFLRHWSLLDAGYEGLVVQAVEEDGEKEVDEDVKKFCRRVGVFYIDQPMEYSQKKPNLKEWVRNIVLV